MNRTSNRKSYFIQPDIQHLCYILTGKRVEILEKALEDESKKKWIELTILAQQHKLIPAFYHAIKAGDFKLYKEADAYLRNQYEEKVFRALSYAGMLVRITREFQNKGILFRVLKGPFISQQIYGNLISRQYSDLDLLIELKDMEASITVLNALGFVSEQPYLNWNQRQKRFYQIYGKDLGFKDSKGNKIELHWKIFTNHLTKPMVGEDFLSHSEDFILTSVKIYGFHKIHQLLYLSVHGYKHSWYRLSWLYDVFILAQQFTDEEIIQLKNKAKTTELCRPLTDSLHLCHFLFGMDLNRFGIKEAPIKKYGNIFRAIEIGKPDHTLSGMIRNQFHLLGLRKNILYYNHQLRLLFNNDKDWEIVKLPAGLFSLYYLLHPFLWFKRQKQKKGQ